MPINRDEFLGSKEKVSVTYPINANFAIIISGFQQKYIVLKAMRRSGGISKILLMKKLKSKVYVSFRIRPGVSEKTSLKTKMYVSFLISL